jgi:hypothetical protein
MEPQSQQAPVNPPVSFPQPREPEGKSKTMKIIIAVVGVIIIMAVGGWFVLGNNSGGGASASPTPGNGLSAFPTPSTTEAPTTSPTPTAAPVNKSEVKIEVLNGTGVPGEAGFLQKALEGLGFEEITAGNADSQDETETVATYSRDLSPVIADEITEKLEELYTTVRTRRATISGGYDVSITTGPRKGAAATAKASATATPKTTATPKPSVSASPTASATATPTATP